jgi:hypothetical protein
MTPDIFFIDFVEEDYKDWRQSPGSLRRAFHAAVSAYHMTDHYYRYHSRYDPGFRQKYPQLTSFQVELDNNISRFRAIQGMVNAYKHLYTFPRCAVGSPGAIESIEYNGVEIYSGYDVESDSFLDVMITHRDGTETKFSEAIEEIIEFWRVLSFGRGEPLKDHGGMRN